MNKTGAVGTGFVVGLIVGVFVGFFVGFVGFFVGLVGFVGTLRVGFFVSLSLGFAFGLGKASDGSIVIIINNTHSATKDAYIFRYILLSPAVENL
jgi:hypothetical protein